MRRFPEATGPRPGDSREAPHRPQDKMLRRHEDKPAPRPETKDERNP